MVLNEYGIIAYNEWMKLPERFPNMESGAFQIMPNHLHGIISLTTNEYDNVGAGFTPAQTDQTLAENNRTTARVAPTTGDIVGAYKSLVSNGCLNIHKSKNKTMGKLWQHNYWEHIIRNEQSFQRISNYIVNNPAKWSDDKFYTP